MNRRGLMDKLFNGATLGAFRILHQIGEGGMAKVYQAYQPSMERYVALKVLPSHYAEDPQFIERFIREARTIAALEHRNILPVFDFGEQDGITYMAMRYVEGGTLKELLNKGRLTMHDILDLMVQICSALDYAHRRGVIHRDVKPSNVILDSEGAAYLMDFGIAKVLGKSGDLTATGAAIGTPAYMAPEQAMGENVDSRTDIYALGIVLYEMVVGRVPFQADTPMAVLMAHLREPLPLPRDFDTSISEPVQAVIIKALTKNPEDRYQTANELAEAFRKALQVSAHKLEASTLVTLIREIQTDRPVSVQARPVTPGSQPALRSTDPRLKERMEQDYIDGLSAFWIRDWTKARACFQAAVDVDPSYKDAANRLQEVEKQIQLADLYTHAQEAMQKDDWRSAMDVLRQLITLDKEYQQSAAMLKTVELKIELSDLYAQAEQLHQAGQWQAVVNIFERMKVLDPNAPDPKGLLAKAKASLAEQQRLEKVKATYQRGLEALEAGRWKEALKLFEQVKAQQPGYGDVEKLIKRVQDEINRSRQRPIQKTSISTKVSPSATAISPGEAQPAASAQSSVEAASERAVDAVTLQAPLQGNKTGKWVLGILLAGMVLFIVLGVAAFAAGKLDPLALALGLIQPSLTNTPQPEIPATPVPVQYLFDNFDESSINGQVDLDRWELVGDCESFTNFGRMVQSGKVVLIFSPAEQASSCQLWTLKGQRVPGVEVGALEAGLNFVEQTQPGYASHGLGFISDYQDQQLKVTCGLGAWSNGKFVQAFSVVETKNGEVTELAYQEVEAAYNHWYTARLLLNPATMTFECRLDGRALGTYQPVNGDVLRQATFGRFLETARGPKPEGRALFDDVRLVPQPGAEKWDQNNPGQVEQPATSPLCPGEIKGWRAEFWDNADLSGEARVCQDVDHIEFDWKLGSPVDGVIPKDWFSARFTRVMDFPAGHYRFRPGSDDGVRLWVDDQLLIDQWHAEMFNVYAADIDLSGGSHALRLEYFETQRAANLTLTWEKDPDVVSQMECIRPYAGMLDWWAGDGDGSNDRLGPGLTINNRGVTFVPGIVAEAFNFESLPNTEPGVATNKYVDERLIKLQKLTIETWVRLDATTPGDVDQNRILQQEKALYSVERFVTLGNKAVLRKEGDGRLHFYMEINGELRHIWSPELLPRGEFIHVAGVYDGTWMILYWNGEKVGALEITGDVLNEGDLYLSSTAEPLFGMLDEVGIYDVPLSEGEIKAIYTAGPFGKCK
jgi:serine/threonine protein kinase